MRNVMRAIIMILCFITENATETGTLFLILFFIIALLINSKYG